jgi:hypothetical protein
MKIVNGIITVVLICYYIFNIFKGYTPTPTDLLGLAILNGMLALHNSKTNEPDN